ncbi:MAG: hypothetical protein Q8P31_11055 [Bacillota bacterium]|nr:hypothetical protein [Bacillota bacterium]
MSEPDHTPLSVLTGYPTSNYHDAMRLLGLRGSFTTGLAPLGTAPVRFAGRATTARFLPSRGRRPTRLTMYDLIERAGAGGVPLLCRGVLMNASAQLELRAPGEALDCAGALVLPGDIVVADGDGAVFVSPADLAEVLGAVRHVASVVEAVMPLVRAGATAKTVAEALAAKRALPVSQDKS